MSNTIDAAQAQAALDDADLLYSAEQVSSALDRLGEKISAALKDTDPLVIVVMNGALMPASQLFSN